MENTSQHQVETGSNGRLQGLLTGSQAQWHSRLENIRQNGETSMLFSGRYTHDSKRIMLQICGNDGMLYGQHSSF